MRPWNSGHVFNRFILHRLYELVKDISHLNQHDTTNAENAPDSPGAPVIKKVILQFLIIR